MVKRNRPPESQTAQERQRRLQTSRLDKIRLLLKKAEQEPEFRDRFLSDPAGVAADRGIVMTQEEVGRASLIQADIWTGALDRNTPMDRVFFAAPAKRIHPPPEPEIEIDPYVRREPWRRAR